MSRKFGIDLRAPNNSHVISIDWLEADLLVLVSEAQHKSIVKQCGMEGSCFD